MKNISFDNPYLLLLAIPAILVVLIPYFIAKNKDNKAVTWTLSVVLHIVIVCLVVLAAAGLATTSVLTETTVYVLADVSESSSQNHEKLDEYISEIKESLPENSKMGVVCFGRDCNILVSAGRKLKSVSEAQVDKSGTDIGGALSFTEKLFTGDSLKRIVLITDGNDTVSRSPSGIASVVERLKENGVKVDAIFLDNTVGEDKVEVQLLETEHSKSAYTSHENEAKFLIQSSTSTQLMLELYKREYSTEAENEYGLLFSTVVSVEPGLNTVRLELPTDTAGMFEYKAEIKAEGDLSSFNNTRTFTQSVVGEERILLITGSMADKGIIETIYGSRAKIDTYVVSGAGSRAPFTLEALVEYDEIVLSNVDIRNIKNANAFVDSLDMVVSQYGKGLVTFGNLQLHTNSDDPIFKKFKELLPVNFGTTNRDGRLYTIVLDISHSMFMASKFTTARSAASRLISILDDEDYICLVTFCGSVEVKTPKKVGECKEELLKYISNLTTDHGTDLGQGLEEALKTIKALSLTENQVMVISDGFSFENERATVDIAKDLFDYGATVSAIDIYVPSDYQGTTSGGAELMRAITNAGKGGNYYEISRPEDVDGVVFGTIAESFSEAVVERESSVSITKYRDPSVENVVSVPNIHGFIISSAKYDAGVPLTITYKKQNGYQESVPLYAYRAHGNGRVASFASSLSGSWLSGWSSEIKELITSNIISSNVPSTRIDHPFTIGTLRTEYDAYIELLPTVLNPEAKTTFVITLPSGKRMTRHLTFDSQKYSYSFSTTQVGTYSVDITYSYGESVYTERVSFEVAYLPEYNAFAPYDKFKVYEFMRGSGDVLVDEIPDMEYDKNEITTYKVSFIIPLLIAAVSVFVVDIFIRKLRVKKRAVKK